MYKEEKLLSIKLWWLMDEMSKIKDDQERINDIKSEIETLKARRARVVKRKMELFNKGKLVKAERNDLRMCADVES